MHFKKGQDKEKVARPYLETAAQEGKGCVVLIGIAQEKASVTTWPMAARPNTRTAPSCVCMPSNRRSRRLRSAYDSRFQMRTIRAF